MKQQLENYINEITEDKSWGLNADHEYTEVNRLMYHGDGQGDFEEMSYDATTQCLVEYVVYCQHQIALAKMEIKKRKLAQHHEDTKTLERYCSKV